MNIHGAQNRCVAAIQIQKMNLIKLKELLRKHSESLISGSTVSSNMQNTQKEIVCWYNMLVIQDRLPIRVFRFSYSCTPSAQDLRVSVKQGYLSLCITLRTLVPQKTEYKRQ